MPITCPKCRTSYQVSDAQIGESGRRVKCVKCEHVWHAMLDNEPLDKEPALTEASAADGADAAPSMPPASPYAAEQGQERTPPSDTAIAENVGQAPGIETPMPDAQASADPLADREDETLTEEPTLDAPDGETGLATTDAAAQGNLHEGLSDESADIIANVSQAMIEIENQGAAAPGAVKAPIVKTETKVKRRTNTAENLGGIAAVAAGILLLFAAVFFRESIVRTLPETAKLYGMVGMQVNLRGLEFTNVATSSDFENGVPVLMVSGTILNVSSEPVALPVVRLALRTGRGQEVYAWSYEPSVKRLAAGEEVDFTTRVASPPDGASDIQLRFIGIDRAATSDG